MKFTVASKPKYILNLDLKDIFKKKGFVVANKKLKAVIILLADRKLFRHRKVKGLYKDYVLLHF